MFHRRGDVISKGYAYWEIQINKDGELSLQVESVSVDSGVSIGDSWRFAAVTYDGGSTESNVVFYLGDGVSVSAVATQTLNKGSITGSSTALWLGDSPQHNGGRPFHGWLDDVRIYNELVDVPTLTAAMIADDAPNAPEPGPLVQLDFNDSKGLPSLVNRGSISVTGEFNGENADYASDVPSVHGHSPGGQSAAFDFVENTTEARNYVTLGNPAELNGLRELTVSLWVRAAASQPGGTTRLLAKDFDFELYLAGNFLGLKVDGQTVSTSLGSVPTDWVFLAATFDGREASDNVVVYSGDGSTLSVVATQTLSATLLPRGGYPLYVGDWNGANGSRGFSGKLDNVRIYERVLGLDQLQDVMITDDAPSLQGTVVILE